MTAEVEQAQTGEPLSLHRRILSDISGRILSGEWSPGRRIPYEHELTVEYGCSRMTVNKALSQLAKAGLIERRRRSGSFVRMPRSQAAILEINDIRAEVQALGLPYRYELTSLARRTATAMDRDRLGIATGASVLAIECRHFAGLRPFCLEDRLICLATVPEAAEASFGDTPPGPWLLGRVPWSAAEHRIRAVDASGAVAEALDVAAGTACLVIERQTWIADQPVTQVLITYPGDSHTLVARFAPAQG